MDFGNKLEGFNMTTDEINRFSNAMKDEKFRELLHEYAQEISDPENKKKYEEAITQLEQERGMEVKFIHPNAHHVLKTSVNGKEKCYINICSNNLIKKPTCEARRDENGQVGQCWSLPYCLTPGRPDRDGKGNKCMIYDVLFHPDTLYMASKNTRFIKLVNSTARQGVEDAFKVSLDKADTILRKIQYKGVPQPAVIRKPIHGQPRKEESSPHDEGFPILYQRTMPVKIPKPSSSSLTQSSLRYYEIKPHYTIKYRSLVDLQDYRFSRDSAASPRPKEIVITIDLPLLKSAADVDLHVTDRKLALESQKPNYKLELQLSYPVDDDKGDAKFNKIKKQLTVTLAVAKEPAKNPVMIHVEGNQPEIDDRDVMGNANKMDEAELIKDEQSDLNISDASCEAQPKENSSVQEEEEEEDMLFSTVEENLPSCTKSVQLSVMAPAVKLENWTQCSFVTKTANGLQLEVPVVESPMKLTATQLEETVHGVQNSVNPSNWVMGKSEVETSVISDGPNQLNFPLDKNTMKTSCRLKVIGALTEDQNSSVKLSSTLLPLNDQIEKVDFSKQSKTDFSITTPAILREENTKDGSEVIIIDYTTSAALSFQNSLWFELD